MKKTPSKKSNIRRLAAECATSESARKPAPAARFSPWSLSVYVYWIIILFFIAATFYILGRSQGMMNPIVDNVQITEETLMPADDYLATGRTKLVGGEIEDAIADLSVALQQPTPPIDAYILRGEAYMQSGSYAPAMDDFTAAINADPTNAVAYFDRALLNTRIEDYAAAMTDINNSLAAQTERPTDVLTLRDIYARRGTLNLWLKNWDGAIADFTNSLAQANGIVNPATYADRAEAYTATSQYQLAIDDYMAAVRVISEQIQGAPTNEGREALSRNAMGYFERSGALNLRMGNMVAAKGDLESAVMIGTALGDTDTVNRLNGLIAEMQ
jgi:tetratricopeptide (TPR) repeat protein